MVLTQQNFESEVPNQSIVLKQIPTSAILNKLQLSTFNEPTIQTFQHFLSLLNIPKIALELLQELLCGIGPPATNLIELEGKLINNILDYFNTLTQIQLGGRLILSFNAICSSIDR